jgi:hypothetical protein
LSEEIHLSNKDVYGTKVGAYFHYFLDVGMALVYYTDFTKGNFKIRPEFGWGMGSFRIAGGYNIPTINNKAFADLSNSKGQLVIQFGLPVRKRKWNHQRKGFKYFFRD